MTDSAHSHRSSAREALLEHLFVGELLRALWCAGPTSIEVLKPQVDDSGYDLVLEANRVLRHVQLKSSLHGAKAASQKIHLALGDKPAGCVIWIQFDPGSLELGPFLWFGSEPGSPLPDLTDFKVARHTRGDSTGLKKERPMIRVVPKAKFRPLEDIGEVVFALFGLPI